MKARRSLNSADAVTLPPEAPMEMPVQDFARRPQPRRRVVTSPPDMTERRTLLILGSIVLGLPAATEMARPLVADGTGILDAALFLLYLSLFCWIGFGFLNALAGFIVLVGQRGDALAAAGNVPLPRRRTAVLVPIYNEDVAQVLERVRRMSCSIDGVGAGGLFDFFILSDSRAEMEARERAACHALRRDCPTPVYYRRRPKNIARKPGNIAEWVGRFGGAYDYMMVLDADSLMSGKAMAQLASAMDRNPGVGLIQTVPGVINARTLFARWQQFAAAAYSPIATAGLIWWSGSESTFWGHNAIIRTAAFAECCGLPELTGAEPFGGHIMSHDMVEAALLRRRGWGVHMVALPDGSHEEFPPTLTDLAVRDRRWCQGNLQHVRILDTAGFHAVSRFQLLMGASAYLTSPLWALLLCSLLLHPLGIGIGPVTIAPSGWLLGLTAMLLFGPKLLSLGWLAMDAERRQTLGGWKRIAASVLVDVPVSMLVAPITMVTQTMAIADILRGRPSGWSAQRRDADGMSFSQALRDYRWHVSVGTLFLALSLIGGEASPWLVPVIGSLLASPFVAAFTSRRDLGDWLAHKGVFRAKDDPVEAGESGMQAVLRFRRDRPGGDAAATFGSVPAKAG